MTGHPDAPDVDWAAVERRAARRSALAVLPFTAVLAALVVVSGRFVFWEGAAAWTALGIWAALALVGYLVAPRLSGDPLRLARAVRIQYAVRNRVDPGPELRTRADVQARYLAQTTWLFWLLPVTPIGLVLGADWERPYATVPAVLVIVGAALWFAWWWRRETAAAQRWVDDPPGPPREPPPLSRRERWLSRRRVLGFIAIGLVAAVVAGLAIGLAAR